MPFQPLFSPTLGRIAKPTLGRVMMPTLGRVVMPTLGRVSNRFLARIHILLSFITLYKSASADMSMRFTMSFTASGAFS